jgi:hypothetical protein
MDKKNRTGSAKRKLLNRAAEKSERIQFADYRAVPRSTWLAQARSLAERIRADRGGQDVDVDALLAANRSDLDARI